MRRIDLLFFAGLLIILIYLYFPSFSSPFFQDDILFLKNKHLSNVFIDMPAGVYRPLGFQIFYSLGKYFFGLNPLGFHLTLFTFSILNFILIFLLSEIFLKNRNKSRLSVFFYAMNVSIFANFYWIAVSYFVIGSFFTFLTVYLYLKKKNLIFLYISFVLALLSNELAIVIPLLLFITASYFKRPKLPLLNFFAVSLIFLLLKYSFFGYPQSSSYKIEIASFFSNARWYILRAINLPEGIRAASGAPLYIAFLFFIITASLSIFAKIKVISINTRMLVFCSFWFIFGALPFFVLPNHMSSFYLTVSLFGSSLFLAYVLYSKKITLFLVILSYLFLTSLGLEFLSNTHWMILKNTGPIGTL